MTEWKAGNEYKTRNGARARIYATDGDREDIHGAILRAQEWCLTRWNSQGRFGYGGVTNNAADLVPPPPRMAVRWANIYEYPTKVGIFWPSKRQADAVPDHSDRIGCKRIEFPLTPGFDELKEGDE